MPVHEESIKEKQVCRGARALGWAGADRGEGRSRAGERAQAEGEEGAGRMTTFTGQDAWRNGFSANAADLLQIVRWAAGWSNETFKQVLVIVGRRTKGERANLQTVDRVLGVLSREGLLTTGREL